MSDLRIRPSAAAKIVRTHQETSLVQQGQDFLAPSGQSCQSQAGIRPRAARGEGKEAQKTAARLALPEFAHLQDYRRDTDPGANRLKALIGPWTVSTLKQVGRNVAVLSGDKTGLRDAMRLERLMVDWLVKRIQYVPAAFAMMWAQQVAARPAPLLPVSAPAQPSPRVDDTTGDPPHDAVDGAPDITDQRFNPDDPGGALDAANPPSEDEAGGDWYWGAYEGLPWPQ
jgi:hypothetical protein